jgi:hypothetical protein
MPTFFVGQPRRNVLSDKKKLAAISVSLRKKYKYAASRRFSPEERSDSGQPYLIHP